ncbi:MAG: sialidase family protein [Methanobacteriota archaeon]
MAAWGPIVNIASSALLVAFGLAVLAVAPERLLNRAFALYASGFGMGTAVAPDDPCESGLDGAPAVAPDGTVIVPKPTCEGMYIATSKDAGKTWTGSDVNDVGTYGVEEGDGGLLGGEPAGYSPNPGAAFDAAGNGYVAFAGKDGLMYLTRSADGAETWSKSVRVTPPAVTSTAFSALVAGADGRVAIAYLGTTAPTDGWNGKAAQWAPNETRWHLYVTVSEDAMAKDPVFTTLQVTPDDDPVQIGCIWQAGGSNPCRNLLDFIDATTDRDGRVFVVYADGCKACSKDTESRRADAMVAVVDLGPSLLSGLPLPAYPAG